MNRADSKQPIKEIIGSFTVTDGTLRQQTVIISQETILDSEGMITETRKHFNLNSVDGEVVLRGESENTLALTDGTVLRKISNVLFGDPEKYRPRVRGRKQR